MSEQEIIITKMKNNQVFIKKYTEHEKITDIKTQSMSKKKDVLVILHRKKRMSFNLFDKNCTQENVQLHLQHGVDLEEL